MIRQFLNVNVGGDACDVHVRLDAPLDDYDPGIAFCGVYVRPAFPASPVPGYWYFPETMAASAILGSLGVFGHVVRS